MFIEKPMTRSGAVNMQMSIQQYYAIMDFFCTDDIARKAILESTGLPESRLNNNDFMMQGYAELLHDKVLEVKYDDTLGVKSFDGNDPLMALMAFNVGIIASTATTYTEIEVMYNFKSISMTLCSNDKGSWFAAWLSNDKVSLIGGFSKDSKTLSILDKITPFMNKSNQTHEMFNLMIRKFAMDRSIIMGTSLYGDSNRFYEANPKNPVLAAGLKNAVIAYDGNYIHTGREAEDRILNILEVM